MVDWTPEAIEAAHRAMFQDPYDGTTAAMIGAGLDAAAAAQGIREEEMSDYKLLCERLLRRSENAEEIAATYQIERDALREENARLLEALKPLAATIKGQLSDILFGSMPNNSTATVVLQLGYLRAAAAAIREGGNDE